MKYLQWCVFLLCLFPLSAKAQVVPDCGNCTNADWNHQWSPALGVCGPMPSVGCGNGCNCWMGFQIVITIKGDATANVKSKMDFFGGAFTPDGGFRIDRPGPLSRNHVKPGDVAYRVNGRRPSRSQFGTPKRPIRRAEATWSDDGKLRLRFYY